MRRPAFLTPPEGAGWLLISGLLLGLAHPPFHLLVPSFVALVPFAVWLLRLPPGEAGRTAALRGGFLLGLVYYTLVFYWLVVSLIYYTPAAILAFVLPVLILSGLLGLGTLAMHRSMHALGWPVWLALSVFWTGLEWLRAHLGDVAFPWMGLGDTLTAYPWLIGAADVVGSRGLSFWLALVNGLVAAAAWRWWGGRKRRPTVHGRAPGLPGRVRVGRLWPLAVGLAAALLIPLTYSLIRWQTLDTRPAARVGVIQPNIPEDLKLVPAAAIDSARISIRELVGRELADADSLDLLLLPETVFPALMEPIPSFGHPGRPDLFAWVADLARHLDAAVLFGAIGTVDLGGGEFDYYNSAYYVNASGERVGRYDKRFLVPIVERVPFVNPDWFEGWFAEALYFGGFGVGEPVPPLALDGGSFGVLICYESIYTQLGRHYRRLGADFLVNITNDAWFGRDEPWWSRTSGLWQHPAHLVMRAIENRVGVARSANTGVSGVVDPRGRWHHRTELFAPAAFAATVRTTDGLTPYARFGDVVGWAAALAALAAVIAGGLRRVEPEEPHEPEAGTR